MRRKFYDLAQGSPAVANALRRIESLYANEDEIRSLTPDERRLAREQHSRPIVEDLTGSSKPAVSNEAPRAAWARRSATRWRAGTA